MPNNMSDISPAFRKNTKEALIFVERFFEEQGIKSVYMGGFAAKLYGSRRELADIDINIPERHLPVAAKYFAKYITFGPKVYKDKNWRLLMFTMSYKGQVVDICSNKTIEIFDKTSGKWNIPDGAGAGVSRWKYSTERSVSSERKTSFPIRAS